MSGGPALWMNLDPRQAPDPLSAKGQSPGGLDQGSKRRLESS